MSSNLLLKLQSAYQAHHSTEPAVFRVLADILRAVDSGDLALLTVLDLSAAFYTVDHVTSSHDSGCVQWGDTALVVPNTLHFTIGDRSFPVAACRV